MALRLSNSSGTFDLPKEFETEIEDSSPIYNERGSQSIAATIPGTRKNLRLNKHIHRTDIETAPSSEERITVADGVYHRVGKMNTVKASESEGITFNVGFGESELYSIWNDVPLNTLKLPIYKPEGGLEEIYTYLNDIFHLKNQDAPFAVFPISVSHIQKEVENYHEYINKVGDNLSLWKGGGTVSFIFNDDLVETTVPTGYGISPFLKVSYILENIFSNYGYTVVENPFASNAQLKWLVVLNNAADCCVKGELKYADLMPSCTINEFFQSLWCRFGLLYFVDGNTRTVRLKFIRDIIKAKPNNDWTLHKASHLTTNFEAAQQLKLSAATNIKGVAPSFSAAPAADSLDKFLKPYNYIVSPKLVGNGFLTYDKERALYYKTDNVTQRVECISSSFFNWDRGADLPYKEITSIDECLPSMLASFWPTYLNLPLYLVGKVHRNTTITSADVELKEKLDTQTPLCFCFAIPKSNITEGRSICLDSKGEPLTDGKGNKFDTSLLFVGKYGLFNQFWKEYDAILRHANHLLEADIHLSAQQRMNPDFSAPVLLDGQRILIDSTRYTLPQNQSSPTKVKFRTIKLLKPYNLDKEQTIPIVDQLYEWIPFDNSATVIANAVKNQKSEWEKESIKYGGTLYDLQYQNVTSDATNIKVPLTVPTEDEYKSQKVYFIRKVNYGFDLYYRIKFILGVTPGGHVNYEISTPRGGVHFDVQYDQSVRAGLL